MKTIDMEVALANFLDYRKYLIVPNISWGMGVHECDLFCVSKSGYATEIEIKISKKDLLKDKHKKHNHRSNLIKYLYFAVPEELFDVAETEIPEESGLIVVSNNRGFIRCRSVKKAVAKPARKLTSDDLFKVARLGTLRAWSYKNKIAKIQNKMEKLSGKKR